MGKINDIIEEYFSAGHDKDTADLFADWLSDGNASEEKDAALFEQWNKDCYVSHDAVEESLKVVSGRINQRKVSGRSAHPVWKWVAMFSSAAAIVALFMTTFYSKEVVVENMPSPMTECYAENGEKQIVLLPDSTTVILNSGSMLIYPETFSGPERKVYLTGEAIFDVKKSQTCPFIVSTRDLDVRVHGTLFNVSSYMDSDFTSATLKEGSISISTGTNGEYLLTPGQALEYDRVADKVFISQVAVDEAFSWKDGKLCFRSESIHSIARKIERYYGCKVYLTTSRYDRDSLTAKFIHGETLDELMSALCLLVPGMKYTIDDSTVYIK